MQVQSIEKSAVSCVRLGGQPRRKLLYLLPWYKQDKELSAQYPGAYDISEIPIYRWQWLFLEGLHRPAVYSTIGWGYPFQILLNTADCKTEHTVRAHKSLLELAHIPFNNYTGGTCRF